MAKTVKLRALPVDDVERVLRLGGQNLVRSILRALRSCRGQEWLAEVYLAKYQTSGLSGNTWATFRPYPGSKGEAHLEELVVSLEYVPDSAYVRLVATARTPNGKDPAPFRAYVGTEEAEELAFMGARKLLYFLDLAELEDWGDLSEWAQAELWGGLA